jgi:hypothetical protein
LALDHFAIQKAIEKIITTKSYRTNYNYISNRTNYNYISNRTRLLCTKIEPIPFGDLFFRLSPLHGEEFLCIDAACIKLIFGEPLPNIIVALRIQMKGK